jgi:ABC-2 type transport system ATP-binding protein
MLPIITLRDLRKSYGRKEVLRDINLDIYPGQVIGYIGPNGAGKSTTVKILCGLLTDYEGEVTVNNLDLRKDSLAVKAMIGYVPELAELYDVLTPTEFLYLMGTLYNLPESEIESRTIGMMQALGLGNHLDQRMETFSKGMKQKVLIASALLHNPEIIILDEPLSGLDANSVIIVKDLIQRMARDGKTIFYCSHMMDVVEKVSDKIVLIDQGVIIANGTYADLKTQVGDKSLEQIFSALTSNEGQHQAADQIMSALKHSQQ